MQSPFLSNLPESSSQPEGEQIKIDKGKKAMSSKDAEEESTKDGKHIHLTEEQINQQKKIEEEAKAEAAKREEKGPITLKVYREDDTSEIIPEFKASDLHIGLDDHSRTFSSLLLAKIDKRNLNPLKQMRVIEQPRE
ncbi:hypothetical protein Tco_0712609 [Tanacetum coccineum]